VCGLGVGTSGCNTRRYFGSRCGNIDITSGPSTDVAACHWSIDVAAGFVVNLTFLQFHTHDSGTRSTFALRGNAFIARVNAIGDMANSNAARRVLQKVASEIFLWAVLAIAWNFKVTYLVVLYKHFILISTELAYIVLKLCIAVLSLRFLCASKLAHWKSHTRNSQAELDAKHLSGFYCQINMLRL